MTVTFHSNHGPISYCFRDRRRFQSKIAKFSHPVYLSAPLKGFPLELGTVPARGVRVYPYPRVRVGSVIGTTSTGNGYRIPGFTRKEHDFSRFWSDNLVIYVCFLNYLYWSNCSMARENSILLGGYNRLLVYFLVFFYSPKEWRHQFTRNTCHQYTSITEQDRKLFQCS